MARIRALLLTLFILFGSVLFGFVGIGPAAALAQSGTVSLDAYRARLDALLTALRQGEEAESVLTLVPPLASPVVLPSGEQVVPAPLFPRDGDRALATGRVASALDQLDMSADDQTAARLAQLEKVANRLDLLQPSLWQRFTRWLDKWLDRLLPDASPAGNGVLGNTLSQVVGWAVIAAGGLLLVLLLSYWLRRLLAGLLTGQQRGDSVADPNAFPVTAAQSRQQASQMAASGNYREAVRRLYLAALLRLAERNLIRYDPSQTNREVLARVEATAPAKRHLAPVVETFDRVWYGEREPDSATFEAYSQEIDALLREQEGPRRG
ncbi:MAG: DUF4129 domain-containing protein [Caldilineaceae bacterium]|nr:DUF4129 domain-containing protein [Caldilineaceae bacterium]